MLRDYEATYNAGGPVAFEPAVADIFQRFEPEEAVRYITAAVERQLACEFKPKTQYAAALMRGLAVREKLKKAEGGSYSAEETRKHLGISKVAVLKRYQKGQLIGWREASQAAVRFPIWQFRDDNLLPGLAEVLEIFAAEEWVDDWKRILFFLNSRESLKGQRPLDLLRAGEIRRVCALAEDSLR